MPASPSVLGRRSIVLALASAIAAVVLGLLVPSMPAEASIPAIDSPTAPSPDGVDCSYATGGEGAHLDSICWLDLSTNSLGEATRQDWDTMALDLPGGYQLTFGLDLHTPYGQFTTTTVDTNAYFGNVGYTGINGPVVLSAATPNYDPAHAILQQITLKKYGVVVDEDFSLVAADAGTTDADESITWRSLTQVREWEHLGKSCSSAATEKNGDYYSYTCTGSSSTAPGTTIVGADSPSNFSVSLSGPQTQAVAFGIVLPSPAPHLTVDVSTDATQVPAPGETVRYTLTASNTGSVPFTADAPAHVTAELRGVVDDAASVSVISPTAATYSATVSRVTWAGLLGVGESAQIVLDVQYSGAGDQKLELAVFGTDAAVGAELPDCAAAVCVSHTLFHPALTVEKSDANGTHAPTPAAASVFVDGESQEFTYTVTNAGNVPLSDVVVTDSFNGAVPVAVCTIPTIPVGDSASCTVNTTVPRFFGSEALTP